eukprot:12690511-Ditylum_brightwellii.AAC.1
MREEHMRFDECTEESDADDDSSQDEPQLSMALENMEQENLKFNTIYSAQYYEAIHESDY